MMQGKTAGIPRFVLGMLPTGGGQWRDLGVQAVETFLRT